MVVTPVLHKLESTNLGSNTLSHGSAAVIGHEVFAIGHPAMSFSGNSSISTIETSFDNSPASVPVINMKNRSFAPVPCCTTATINNAENNSSIRYNPRCTNFYSYAFDYRGKLHIMDKAVFDAQKLHLFALNSDSSWTIIEQKNREEGPPDDLHFYSAIYHPHRDSVIIFGGLSGDDREMMEFSLLTNKWSHITYTNKSPFSRMFLAGLSLHDGKLIVFGGINSSFSLTGNAVNAFNFITRSWEKLSDNVTDGPKNRYNHAKAIIGDCLYVYGGFNEEVQNSLNDLWEYDLNERKWRAITLDLGGGLEKPIYIHACSAALYQQSKLVMIGGFNSNYEPNPGAYVIDFGNMQPDNAFPRIHAFVKEKLFADCTIKI